MDTSFEGRQPGHVFIASSTVGLKIRVLGTHRPLRGSPIVTWAYRAEAYDEDDRFHRAVWSCTHAHDAPHTAQSCGEEWLASGAVIVAEDQAVS